MSEFDDLRQIREDQENAKKRSQLQASEEQERQRVSYAQVRSRMKQSTKDFDDTVKSVLTELQTAVYPGLSINGPRIIGLRIEGEVGRWFIGRTAQTEQGEFQYPVVEVRLEFSENGEASRFVCCRAPIETDRPVPQPKSLKSRLFGTQGRDAALSRMATIHFEPISCDLNQHELVNSLRALHPSHTIGARVAQPGSGVWFRD